MNFLLIPLIVLIVVLIAAKIYTDRQPDRGASMHASPKRRAKLSNELAAATRDAEVRDRLVDTDGRVALALVGEDQLVLVTAEWTARKGGEDSAAFSQRVLEIDDLVYADVREPFYTERLKNGIGPIYIEAVDLTVFVNDLDTPVYYLNLLEDDVLAGSAAHLAARDAAMHWEGVIRALVFRAAGQRAVKGQLQALQARARGA